MFAWRMRFRSDDIMIAPSILHSSNRFCGVKRELILKPPSVVFCSRNCGESKTISAPMFDRTTSSIMVRIGVPGETNFRRSFNVFSFWGAISEKNYLSIYRLREVFKAWIDVGIMERSILNDIRRELVCNVDEKYRENSVRFFREDIKNYGVRTPVVRQIAKKYFKEVRCLDKGEVFVLCRSLFGSLYNEEATIAVQWLSGIGETLDRGDFGVLEEFFCCVDNWAKCDDFCLSVLSHFIVRFPELKGEVKNWSRSSNMWKRRAAAVSFIRGGSWLICDDYLKDVFEVADLLLEDEEDLVRKGYGWMLKVAADSFREDVFDFVMKRRVLMPRVALRYAIEKMPREMRSLAL